MRANLFVCWGDLMVFFAHDVSMWRFACASVSSTFHHLCFPLLISLSLLNRSLVSPSFPRSLPFSVCVCVCVSRYECVTAVVCLLTFSALSTFTRKRDLHWTWPWIPNPASTFSLFLSLFFSSVFFLQCKFCSQTFATRDRKNLDTWRGWEDGEHTHLSGTDTSGTERKKTQILLSQSERSQGRENMRKGGGI